jgi:hypothetical protein
MKQKQNQSSTQAQTFDPYNLSGRDPFLTYGSVWKDPSTAVKRKAEREQPVQTFEDYGFAYFYEQKDGSVLTAIPPNPPTPEAVAKAQFVDKTYVWKPQ